MPSHQIHLAIAKRYIEKNKIENEEEFIEGSIAPDFVRPKEKSHYTIPASKENLWEYVKSKVDLQRFLKENEIKTYYDKGIFLHLLTDRKFFTEFFNEEFYKKTNYNEFTENLYTSYTNTNEYLIRKYHIILKEEIEEKIKKEIHLSKEQRKISGNIGKDILPLEKLDAFIEEMSDINIEEYLESLKINGRKI